MPMALFTSASGIAAQQHLLYIASTRTLSTLMQMAQVSY